MAQGTRGWIRAATIGLSVMLCTGLVGCMDKDKKDTKATTAPKAGLPGTPMLPQTNTGAAANKWQPNNGAFTGAGANIQPTGGFGTQPGGAPYQPGRTGMNTNTSGSVQPANYTSQPGYPGAIGAPVPPTGYPTPSVQPGPIGAAPATPAGGVAAGYSPGNPPAPALGLDGPLPPPAPTHGEFAGGALLPPALPTPITPPSAPIYQPIKGNF